VGSVSAPPVGGAKAPGDHPAFPGEKFGLPEDGPRSVASMARRLGALLIDWVICVLIAFAALHPQNVDPLTIQRVQYWALAIFAAENFLLTALTGLTLGKRLTGIRVARLDGKPVGFGWALLRTVLLLCVIPALVTDRDLRGLHDRAANTIVVRL
jgi:uncharacterized RDD family membrane protein YckC